VDEQLRSVHQQITDRIRDNERLRIQQNDFAERARVAGRIAYYLENITVQDSWWIAGEQHLFTES
jgi:hypothetical protein